MGVDYYVCVICENSVSEYFIKKCWCENDMCDDCFEIQKSKYPLFEEDSGCDDYDILACDDCFNVELIEEKINRLQRHKENIIKNIEKGIRHDIGDDDDYERIYYKEENTWKFKDEKKDI